MYARLATYRLRIEDEGRARAPREENPALTLIAGVEGCRGVYAMWPEEEQDAPEGDVTVVSFWDTREQAERLGEVIGQRQGAVLGDVGMAVVGPPQVRVLVAEGRPVGA